MLFVLVNFLPSNWQEHVDKWIPFNAGSQVWAAVNQPGSHLFSAWTGLGVFARLRGDRDHRRAVLFLRRDA